MNQSDPIILTDLAGDDLGEIGENEVETQAFEIIGTQHGRRLDQVLAELAPRFSRSYLQQLIAAGAVRLEGFPVVVKPALKVKAGQRGAIELRPTTESQAFKAEPIELCTVHEDEHLRVLNKAAGLVVHPAPGNWGGTVLNGLLALDAKAASLPRAGIVHRLDKDTSGLMVVARTREAMDGLVRAIAAREVRREYLALAHKRWSGAAERLVDAPIGRDPRNRLRMAVVDPARTSGKAARTDAALIENSERGCFVRCRLQTGRTHQIRVHMASIGHPLVADTLYGGAPGAGMTRQALHAWRLGFTHPVSGRPLRFEAPLPADLGEALAQWEIDAEVI